MKRRPWWLLPLMVFGLVASMVVGVLAYQECREVNTPLFCLTAVFG